MGFDDQVSDYFAKFDSQALLGKMIKMGNKQFPTRDLKQLIYYMELINLYATASTSPSGLDAAEIKRLKEGAKTNMEEIWEKHHEDEPTPPPKPARRPRRKKAEAALPALSALPQLDETYAIPYYGSGSRWRK